MSIGIAPVTPERSITQNHVSTSSGDGLIFGAGKQSEGWHLRLSYHKMFEAYKASREECMEPASSLGQHVEQGRSYTEPSLSSGNFNIELI